MKIHQVIDATERRKNELKNTLKEIEASLIQSKTVDETIKAQMQRLIERTSLELQNLESQLHDAHDIDYVEFTQTKGYQNDRCSKWPLILHKNERCSKITVIGATDGHLGK